MLPNKLINFITKTLMFIQQLLHIVKKAQLRISVVGGSNSVIRRGYAKHLNHYLSQTTALTTSVDYYSLGGVPSVYGTIQQDRHNIAAKSDIIFFEYCVNDRHAVEVDCFSLDLAGRSLEGFIRKAHKANPNCLIIILIFGINLDSFYDRPCRLSELYESIGKHYNLTTINLTKVLSQAHGLEYVKSLYDAKDHAHYTRPQGVQVVAQAVLEELAKSIQLKSLHKNKRSSVSKDKFAQIKPIYPDNFENLNFIDQFDEQNFFAREPRVSVYQNTVFKEKNYTIDRGNSMNFLLKGKLVAIFIKSDLNDGFIEIKFDRSSVVTSSYSSWVNKIKPQNVLNLIVSPLRGFAASQDFVPVSIAPYSQYSDRFNLGYEKAVPTKHDPQKWKLNIIGIAYVGEIKPMD